MPDDSAFMKPSATLLSSLCVLAALAVPAPRSRAQTTEQTTTTTTTTVLPGTSAPATPVPVQEGQTVTVQPTPAVIVPQPGQHVAEIDLAVSRGSVRAYFGKAARGEKAEIGGLELNIKLPSTATVTKIASRDTDSDGPTRITAETPWHTVVPFTGAGRYVFNIVGWDNDPVVTDVTVKIDGVVIFSGHGREDDFDDWSHKTYGPGVRKTGGREIAFNLAAAP